MEPESGCRQVRHQILLECGIKDAAPPKVETTFGMAVGAVMCIESVARRTLRRGRDLIEWKGKRPCMEEFKHH